MPRISTLTKFRLMVAIVGGVSGFEWGVQYLVRLSMPIGVPWQLIDHTLYLEHLEHERHALLNPFTATGLAARYDIPFNLLLMLFVVGVYSVTPPKTQWLRIGLALVVADMVASGLEVVVRSRSTDFLGLGDLAVLNLGDVALFTGVILCSLVTVFALFAPEKLPWPHRPDPE